MIAAQPTIQGVPKK